MTAQLHHPCLTLAARIARGFHSSLGVTPGCMHSPEEQVSRRPSMRCFAERKELGLRSLRQAWLEARPAVTLDMKPWRLDGVLQAHAVVEQIDGDLKDRRPDAVRAAGAERRYCSIGL